MWNLTNVEPCYCGTTYSIFISDRVCGSQRGWYMVCVCVCEWVFLSFMQHARRRWHTSNHHLQRTFRVFPTAWVPQGEVPQGFSLHSDTQWGDHLCLTSKVHIHLIVFVNLDPTPDPTLDPILDPTPDTTLDPILPILDPTLDPIPVPNHNLGFGLQVQNLDLSRSRCTLYYGPLNVHFKSILYSLYSVSCVLTVQLVLYRLYQLLMSLIILANLKV